MPPKPDLASIAAETIAQIQSSLPSHLRSASTSLPTIYLARPNRDVLGPDFDPDLLGLFEGPNRLEADPTSSNPPPRLLLFLENIWAMAEHDLPTFRQEVRTTYLHELGHFLGFDEDDLTARNLD